MKFESAKEDLQNKPEEIRNKIVEGRVDKTLKKQVLLEQEFIRNPSITVNEYIKQVVGVLGENIRISRFTRYVLGETQYNYLYPFRNSNYNILLKGY